MQHAGMMFPDTAHRDALAEAQGPVDSSGKVTFQQMNEMIARYEESIAAADDSALKVQKTGERSLASQFKQAVEEPVVQHFDTVEEDISTALDAYSKEELQQQLNHFLGQQQLIPANNPRFFLLTHIKPSANLKRQFWNIKSLT